MIVLDMVYADDTDTITLQEVCSKAVILAWDCTNNGWGTSDVGGITEVGPKGLLNVVMMGLVGRERWDKTAVAG